jgi:hypothetical protein
MRQKHDEDVLGDNHAGGSFISEMRIKLEAELSKELDRLFEVLTDRLTKIWVLMVSPFELLHGERAAKSH